MLRMMSRVKMDMYTLNTHFWKGFKTKHNPKALPKNVMEIMEWSFVFQQSFMGNYRTNVSGKFVNETNIIEDRIYYQMKQKFTGH